MLWNIQNIKLTISTIFNVQCVGNKYTDYFAAINFTPPKVFHPLKNSVPIKQ